MAVRRPGPRPPGVERDHVLQLGTVEQVDALRDRLSGDDLEITLEITEVRWCDRGVLVRLDLR
ncbi:hypothetical protein GCM10027062_27140 [Nocardioides hungaricus]